MSGATSHVLMVTAQHSSCLAELSQPPFLPCNRRSFLSTSIRLLHQKTMHAKSDHDRSKLSLSILSPRQSVYLQDSKSSAWEKQGFIVSMRPNRLSYIVNVDNRFFTRPRCLLRPVNPDTLTSISSPAHVSFPPLLRRSLCLQSPANTAVLQTPLYTSPSSSDPPSKWLPSSSVMDRASSTISTTKSSSRSGHLYYRRPRPPLQGRG